MRVDARFRSSDGTGWCLAVQAWGLPSLPRLGAIWVLLLAGCGGSEFAIAPVSGTVTQDGKPLADVVVTFQPIAETRAGSAGPGSFGVTDDQGRFTLTVAGSRQSGAVVGLHRVMFSAKARERDSSDDTVDRSSKGSSGTSLRKVVLCPNRQRREGFLGGQFGLDLLGLLLLLGRYLSHLRCSGGLLIWFGRPVTRSLGAFSNVAVRDRVRQQGRKLLARLRDSFAVTHAATESTHRMGQTSLGGIGDLLLGPRLPRLLRQLLFQGEQLGHGHRHDRPVQFRQQASVIAATKLRAIHGLFEPAEFHFDTRSPCKNCIARAPHCE
jgi:hypothetical protein